MKDWLKVLIFIVVLASLLALLYYIGYRKGEKEAITKANVQVDTLVIHDTIRCVEPKEIAVRIVDTAFIPVTDTIRVQDTLYIREAIEQKVYGNSDYRAVISGIHPKLDSLQIFKTDRIITNTVVKPAPKFGFSVQAGLGVQYGFVHRQADFGAYLGAGVHYRF